MNSEELGLYLNFDCKLIGLPCIAEIDDYIEDYSADSSFEIDMDMLTSIARKKMIRNSILED